MKKAKVVKKGTLKAYFEENSYDVIAVDFDNMTVKVSKDGKIIIKSVENVMLFAY
jgi:hypothetical protein